MEPRAEFKVPTLAEIERRYILWIVAIYDRNLSEAAKALGIDRKTLSQKLHQYGVLVTVNKTNVWKGAFGAPMEGEKIMGDLSEHFSKSELACKDCGECKLNPLLVPSLEQLRVLAGAPIQVDCGYRCATHNREVGGVSKSSHLDGEAADLKIEGKTLQEMYDLAEQVKAFADGGIGVYDTGFIHVDVRGDRLRWARVKGEYTSIAASKLLDRH